MVGLFGGRHSEYRAVCFVNIYMDDIKNRDFAKTKFRDQFETKENWHGILRNINSTCYSLDMTIIPTHV